MTTEFVLYHAPLSQPCRSILLLLKLTNAPYKEILIDLIKGEHRTPEFLAINPFHRVPVVVHGDFVLTESAAIAKYIINNVQCEDHWYPADAKKRARVDEYLFYHPTGVRKGCRGVAINFYFREKISGKPVPQEEKDAAYTEFLEVVTGFENYFLSRGPFIIGDKISIADLFAVSEGDEILYFTIHQKCEAVFECVGVGVCGQKGCPELLNRSDVGYRSLSMLITDKGFIVRNMYCLGRSRPIRQLFNGFLNFTQIIQAQLSGIDFLSDRPKLKEYVERVKYETSPHFDDVFKKIFEIIATRTK